MLNFDKPLNPQATLDDVVYAYILFLKRFPDNAGFLHYWTLDYGASHLDEVQIYLCPPPSFPPLEGGRQRKNFYLLSICGSYFLMYCTQLRTAIFGDRL